MRFAGATIIITGAAGGLGSAMATAFAAEGGRVMLLDLPSSPGEKVGDQINQSGLPGSARFVPCDLADLDRTATAIAGIVASDGVSVLVNNAAIYPSKPVGEYSIGEWQSVQRVNVDAAFVCAQAVLPGMRAAGSGRIVNISSITFFGGLDRLVPYVG
jgi:3-oxoacyl-[acyl-carrier protein] reductase